MGLRVLDDLSGEIATTEDRDFERRVLPLLRFLFPKAIAPPALRGFDQAGADHLVWSDKMPFPLVVQCKGFRVSEHEIGKSQIDQCLKSIDSFARSGLKAVTYLLLYNRVSKDLNDAVLPELSGLKASGIAAEAIVWNRNQFLDQIYSRVRELVHRAILDGTAAIQKRGWEFETPLCQPLRSVPLRSRDLKVSPNRVETILLEEKKTADPSTFGIFEGYPKQCLLIGEAGFGKTTTVHEGLGRAGRTVLYVPASTIAGHTSNSTDLLSQCVDMESILADVDADALSVIRRIAKAAISHEFKRMDTTLTLVIDGLDEAVFLARPGSLQLLVNLLRGLRTPVLLTARTEFYTDRARDFATPVGRAASTRDPQLQTVRLVELLPWSDEHLVELTCRYRDTLTDSAARARLEQLSLVFKNGEYVKYYGDIPRRPLFLRFILETVAAAEIQEMGRAHLFFSWARMKVERDVAAPRIHGHPGRLPLTEGVDSIDSTVDLSFRYMMAAARRMTRISDGRLELLPDCKAEDISATHQRLPDIREPLPLLLHSLLVLSDRSQLSTARRVRFAHRAYQEFFLALSLYREFFEARSSFEIPAELEAWMDHLRREKFPTD